MTPDDETELFNILSGVLQRDTLAPYIFIIAFITLYSVLDGRGEGLGFHLKKGQSTRNKGETLNEQPCEVEDPCRTTSTYDM